LTSKSLKYINRSSVFIVNHIPTYYFHFLFFFLCNSICISNLLYYSLLCLVMIKKLIIESAIIIAHVSYTRHIYAFWINTYGIITYYRYINISVFYLSISQRWIMKEDWKEFRNFLFLMNLIRKYESEWKEFCIIEKIELLCI
jgi:hypothetical protein